MACGASLRNDPDLLSTSETAMEKIVRKYKSHAEAEQAEIERYAAMTPEERLQVMIEINMPEDPNEGAIERCVRIHPLHEQ